MNAAILYAPAGIVTGRRLRRALGIHGGRKWLPHLFGHDVDVLIRWGSRVSAPAPSLREINDAATLAACATRWQMIKALSDADGVVTPALSLSPFVDRPYLGRSNYGMQGRDVTWYEEGVKPSSHHNFFMEYLSKEREWRVHIIDGRIVKVLEKTGGSSDEVIWNYANSFRFTYPGRGSIPRGIRPMAKAAVDTLRLDIGAVDLITYKGRHYVLEVNTAPGLSDLSLDTYVLHLRRMIHEDDKECVSVHDNGS